MFCFPGPIHPSAVGEVEEAGAAVAAPLGLTAPGAVVQVRAGRRRSEGEAERRRPLQSGRRPRKRRRQRSRNLPNPTAIPMVSYRTRRHPGPQPLPLRHRQALGCFLRRLSGFFLSLGAFDGGHIWILFAFPFLPLLFLLINQGPRGLFRVKSWRVSLLISRSPGDRGLFFFFFFFAVS